MREESIKLSVVGDAIQGEAGDIKSSLKTALLLKYAYSKEELSCLPTIFDNRIMPLLLNGNRVELSLWDTSGLEEYPRLRPQSYSHTDVILLVFHYNSTESYENAEKIWFREIKHYLPNTPIVLVGVKDNFVPTPTQPNTKPDLQKIKKKAKALGIDIFVECSLDDYASVQKVFNHALVAALASKAPTMPLAQMAFQAFTKDTSLGADEKFILQAIEIATARRVTENNFFSAAPIDVIKKILVELARAEGCEQDPTNAINLIMNNVRFKKAANWDQFATIAGERKRIFEKRESLDVFFKDFACFYFNKDALTTVLEKEPAQSPGCTIS